MECESPRYLPFALIACRHMNDMITPFKVLPPFVDNTIIMEKHHNEITS